MVYKRPPHYVWAAFCEMARHERITAQEAIERLQAAFPYEAVEAIIRAEGDMSKTLDDVTSAPLPDLSKQAQSSGNQQGQPSSQQGNQPASGSQQSSGNQQGQPAKLRQTAQLESDFNAMLRARASRGTNTVTLPREAITGVKGQGAYKPEDDPFRARFAEKYGS